MRGGGSQTSVSGSRVAPRVMRLLPRARVSAAHRLESLRRVRGEKAAAAELGLIVALHRPGSREDSSVGPCACCTEV
ncbi:hypothetical protein NDU88_000434 [Pleurodeles waltl]|uniref:Uncharacterized protein n=1 Tax=Pleurodeles waltl TaxID=8319 RepID=A0AAV7LY56_PLEWA|nr:hypothetical protein NDU88_000434 [Pleurodeles waltl]